MVGLTGIDNFCTYIFYLYATMDICWNIINGCLVREHVKKTCILSGRAVSRRSTLCNLFYIYKYIQVVLKQEKPEMDDFEEKNQNKKFHKIFLHIILF